MAISELANIETAVAKKSHRSKLPRSNTKLPESMGISECNMIIQQLEMIDTDTNGKHADKKSQIKSVVTKLRQIKQEIYDMNFPN
jgi:hypothetical protein